MSWHLFEQNPLAPPSAPPAPITVNLRSRLDSSGPHLIIFTLRTITADPGTPAGQIISQIRYEDDRHLEQIINGPVIQLSTVDAGAGGVGSIDMQMCLDGYYGLNQDGALGDPNGLFVLEMFLAGDAGSAMFAYELLVSNPNDDIIVP